MKNVQSLFFVTMTLAVVSGEFQQPTDPGWLATKPLVKRRRSANSGPVENDGWSKAADVIPFPLRTSSLGKSLIAWLNVTNHDFVVDYDKKVEFSCKNNVTQAFAEEYARMTWRWVKDGDAVVLDASHKVQTDNFVLFIEKLHLSDAGTYECRMELGNGTELTADVFALTVLPARPTLVVRETEPFEVNCRSEALVSFLHNLDLSSSTDNAGWGDGSHTDKTKRAAEDEDSSGLKGATTEHRFQKFVRLEEGGFQEWGLKNVNVTSHAPRLARRESSANAGGSARKDTITQRWIFQGTETQLFPGEVSANGSSSRVVRAAARNMTGDWACQISHVTTARTWRTAWYMVRVASPPPAIELWWRRVLVYPWAVAVVALVSLLAFVGLSVLVAHLGQVEMNLEERFFAVKRRLLRHKDLLWSDSMGEAERQMLKRHPSAKLLAGTYGSRATLQAAASKDGVGLAEEKESSSDDDDSKSEMAGSACRGDGYVRDFSIRRGSTDLDAAYAASRAT